jgi:hypothetical protein
MPDSQRLAHVHHDEHDAHGDRCDGQELPEEHDLFDGFKIVEVRGDHEQHGRRRDAHEESEVRDEEAPGHLVPHRRRDQPPLQLVGIGAEAEQDED